ncbi:hypothetical protein LM601598_30025 [Listeria monocytogenes]|nr:hypothetical protein LM601598_30025 [Listeria monocytogenes]
MLNKRPLDFQELLNTVSNKTVCNERNNLRTQLLLGVFFYGIISQNY